MRFFVAAYDHMNLYPLAHTDLAALPGIAEQDFDLVLVDPVLCE